MLLRLPLKMLLNSICEPPPTRSGPTIGTGAFSYPLFPTRCRGQTQVGVFL